MLLPSISEEAGLPLHFNSRGRIASIAAVLLLAIASEAIQFAAKPQAAAPGSVDGIVVRWGTDTPIAGVNIEMRRVEGTVSVPLLPSVYANGYTSPGAIVIPANPNPAESFYATTSSDGAFRFTNLKPGKYRLLAAHPNGNYYLAEFGQRNPRGPGYDFSIEDPRITRLRMEMAPLASISGRVVGADGNPAAHAHVFAAEIAYQNGSRVLNQMQGVETDERGNYRLFWLPPGRYFVGAFLEGIRRRQYSVPFGPPGRVESMNQTFTKAFLLYSSGSDGEVVRDVYQTVYSPGVTNPDTANMIDLRLGTSMTGVDIALAPGRNRAVKIHGVVTDGANGQPVRNASVQAVPQLTGPITVAPSINTDSNGAYELDGLMLGKYSIVATSNENNTRRFAVQALSVDSSDIAGINLTLSSGVTVQGRVTLDGSAAEGIRITLARDNNVLLPGFSAVSVGGAFSITGVAPGTYRVVRSDPASAGANPSYIQSIRFGGVVEPSDPKVEIGNSGLATLDVALGRSSGTAEGRVVDAQHQPSANVMVVLVPTDVKRLDLFKTATTDLAGQFHISSMAPGTYLAFAWPWVPGGIWQVPEFLNSVERRGTRVVIPDGTSANLELTLLPEPNP
jgi:protocatechuate 3,4-dioxygenase beta subunit